MRLPTLSDEIDRLFDELVHRRWRAAEDALSQPRLREAADAWTVEVSLPPGMTPGDVRLELRGRELMIDAHRRRQHLREGELAGWTSTVHEVTVHQSVMLPDTPDPEGLQATIRNNLLVVRIRKRPHQ